MSSRKKIIKETNAASSGQHVMIGHTFGVMRFLIAMIISIAMIVVGLYSIFYGNQYIIINSLIHEKNLISDTKDSCNPSNVVVTCLGMIYNFENKSYIQKVTVTDTTEPSYVVGSSLSMYINPKNPNDFMIANDTNKKMLRSYFIFGIVLVILGILILILSIIKIYLIFHHNKFAEFAAYYNVAV
jgi:uncharacterized membrane protein